MGLMDAIFRRESKALRQLKASYRQSQRNTERQRPLFDLVCDIGRQSHICAQRFLPLYMDGEKGLSQEIWTTREFVFCLSHLASRLTLARHGNVKYDQFSSLLVEFGAVFFGERHLKLSPDKKQPFYDSFLADFRVTDKIYSECEKIISDDVASEDDTVLFRLATMVSRAFALTTNQLRVREMVQNAALSAFTELQPEKQIDAVIAAIDFKGAFAPGKAISTWFAMDDFAAHQQMSDAPTARCA
jgi:hypothetical protein